MKRYIKKLLKESNLETEQLCNKIEEIYNDASKKYMTMDEYYCVEDKINEINNSLSYVLEKLKDMAYRNTYKYMEEELDYIVRTNIVNSLEDFNNLIDDFKLIMIDDERDYDCLKIFEEVRQYCIEHPERAKNYIQMED